MSSGRKRSPVWQYFDISTENNKWAICLICGVQISRGGEGKKAGTSALNNHLKTKHLDKATLENPTTQVINVLPGTSPSTTNDLMTSKPVERKLWDTKDAKIKKYNYLITEMIALDNLPLSVVENFGFFRLLQQILPRFEIPTAAIISQEIVPDMYSRIHEKIRRQISEAPAISVSCNLWRCLRNDASYVTFTAHWLSSKFRPQQGVLTMKPLAYYSKENIVKELSMITTRWDIDQRKIHLLIHESNAVVVKSEEATEYDCATCLIDSVNKVVSESIKMQTDAVEMIVAVRNIVTHFSCSESAQEKLLSIQKELGLPEHHLVQDIHTRWNSTYYMLERLLEQRRSVILYAADQNTLNNLTVHQWHLIEQFVKLLKPFEEITKTVSSSFCYISEAIPYAVGLKKFLHEDKTAQATPDLPYVRSSLEAEIESLFNSLRNDSNYLIATLLDPRFKADFLEYQEVERAQQKILLDYIKMVDAGFFNSDSSSPTSAKRFKSEEAESTTTDTYFTYSDTLSEDGIDSQCDEQDHKYPIAREISKYLKTVHIDRSLDPHDWWLANSNQYPNLTKFARIYVAAPCSSVSNETLFSEAGLLYENKRNRLLPIHAEKMVFIQQNLPLVNFEY